MRRRGRTHIALHGLFTLWMAAIAIAPLWHGGHVHRVMAPAEAPAHQHGPGLSLCGVRPHVIDVVVDCVLCQAQRLLGHSWARVPDRAALRPSAAPVVETDAAAPRAADWLPLAARAPPLG